MNDTLTEKELAERWKLTTRTLQGWRSRGIGPRFVRLGERSIFYRTEDIMAYEKANVVGKPTAPDGWEVTVKRAASAFDTLAQKSNPAAKTTLHNMRDELRALLE